MELRFSGGLIAIGVEAAMLHYRFEYVLPGGQGVVVVDDAEVPLPRGNELECRAEGLWFACYCETLGEHWTFGLEAFGLRYDDTDSAVAGGYGDRLPVGYDLEWEVSGPDGQGQVRGTVLVAEDVIEIDEPGSFAA
jgi:hypothetical protein